MLTEEGKIERERTAFVPETVPALFLLSGVIFAFRAMMYGDFCLLGAFLTGNLVILALKITEGHQKAFSAVKAGIYVVSLLSFLGAILYVSQGFLDTVNRFMVLWNLRFRTELEQFSVNARVPAGSLLFWCLLAVLLGAGLAVLVKRRNVGMILAFVCCGLLAGFILGRSSMWISVLCLILGVFGMLVFSAAPGRQNGIRGFLCLGAVCAVVLILIFVTGGYEGLSQIARWRADAVAWFEKFRYGEDTLPKGEMGKAHRLLEGEEETLRVDMEEAQEWYLKGFVGGIYDGSSWKELPMDAYQGEYGGLLEWLKTKKFSALTQYAGYQQLTDEEEGTGSPSVRAEVTNIGAYRKYIYLPASVESWSGGSSKEQRDWQVRSRKFFGADEYKFQAVDVAYLADAVQPGEWMQNPSGPEEEMYLGAESVYRSFTEKYYMEVDEGLRELIEDMFFSEKEEKDFYGVTAQIRRTLRREARYMESPPAMPAGENFTQWFLRDSKRGNAVHYASAAVLAYRTAGYAARYAEGYHYEKEKAQELFDNGETTGILTNKNAHVWPEVYLPGVGWLPVEVVPGMYTELYTNHIVEGAPAYEVNGDSGDEGVEVQGGPGDEEEREEPPKEPLTLRQNLSIILILLYGGLILYGLLEIQRAVRLRRRKQAVSERGDQAFIDRYVKETEQLFLIGKVVGDYDHPLELSAQVEEKIRGITREEYERAVQLIQKVRFGGKELLPYEVHTLECFQRKFLKILYWQKGLWRRMKVRYWYALVLHPDRNCSLGLHDPYQC